MPNTADWLLVGGANSLRTQESSGQGCPVLEAAQGSHALEDIGIDVTARVQGDCMYGFPHGKYWLQFCLVVSAGGRETEGDGGKREVERGRE